MSEFLEGEYESIKVLNGYCVPFETGFLLVLYQFARPVHLRPELEKIFGIIVN